MSKMLLRGVVPALAWLGLLAPHALTAPRWAAWWLDVQAAAGAGPAAWPAVQAWGWRSRWESDRRGDRQRARDGCGAASLHVLLATRGCSASQDSLQSLCRLPQGGTTLGRLARAARLLGCDCEVRSSPTLEGLPLPALVHLRRGHFVVLEPSAPAWARVFDPACGQVRLPWAELRGRCSGAVLVLGASEARAAAMGRVQS